MMPSLVQLTQIPPHLTRTVPAEHLDSNGHMNVRHFFNAHVDASGMAMAEIGVDQNYVAQRRLGFFTAEHHLQYVAEVLSGDRISVHVRFLERSEKVLHNVSFLVNQTRGALACVFEVLTVHIDQSTRRAVAMPPDVAVQVERKFAVSQALDWSTPMRLSLRREPV